MQRYAPCSTNDYGEDYCKCKPDLIPDPEGRAVLHADAQAEMDKLKSALQRIHDNTTDCECAHDDENCCALKDDFCCAYCIAAVALRSTCCKAGEVLHD